MPNARGSRYPARRAERRKTVWIGTADQGAIAIATNTSVVISSFAPDALSILKATVVRTRGILLVQPQVFTSDLNWNGAFGLGIVSDEALAAGTGSIPRPFDDDDWAGWLVHGYYSGFNLGSSADPGLVIDTVTTIDSKAMRKVGPNESLVWMAESQVGAVSVTLNARVLMMLS